MGEHGGANQADRWRKRMRQGRTWRVTTNVTIWALIVAAMAISITLILMKARL